MFFFTSSQGYTLYMGKDKFENEELIKYGLPEDVWFHVDGLSSAHVYLRQKDGESFVLDEMDPSLVNECCQLVKDNSIEGCKLANCPVVYTRWKNLKKTDGMAVGQIGYHDMSKQRRIRVDKDRALVNALNKTKREEHPDLQTLQWDRMQELERAGASARKAKVAALKQRAKEDRKAKLEHEDMRSYKTLFQEAGAAEHEEFGAKATKDQSAAEEFEDDFM